MSSEFDCLFIGGQEDGQIHIVDITKDIATFGDTKYRKLAFKFNGSISVMFFSEDVNPVEELMKTYIENKYHPKDVFSKKEYQKIITLKNRILKQC